MSMASFQPDDTTTHLSSCGTGAMPPEHAAALTDAIKTLSVRNRRHITLRNVVSKLRQQKRLDTARWAESLSDNDLIAFLNTLWVVHDVVNDGTTSEPTVVPVTLTWPVGSIAGEADVRIWGRPPAAWIRRSRVLVQTASQCRNAVIDLRTRPFVSVVVDASPQHDLGLVHVAALGDDQSPARCYTFDVCATPMSEWRGAIHLFDWGHLARFLGDPAIPKAVCGSGSGHDTLAHSITRHLRRMPKARASPQVTAGDRSGGCGLLLRHTVQVLPPAVDDESGRVARAIDRSLRAHQIDADAWRTAGMAPRGDRWYWLRRPLSPRTLENCAERAFSLCVAYDAVVNGALWDKSKAPAIVAQPVTDSLLCIAAAQRAASVDWSMAAMVSHVDGDDDDTVAQSTVQHNIIDSPRRFDVPPRRESRDAHCCDNGDGGVNEDDGNDQKRFHSGQDVNTCRSATITTNDRDLDDRDEKDWDDLQRAMDSYRLADDDDRRPPSPNESMDDGDDSASDDGDWYGDGHGTSVDPRSEFSTAP